MSMLKDWIGKYFLTPLPAWIPRSFDLEKNLNEDGKKWFSELRLNGSSRGL